MLLGGLILGVSSLAARMAEEVLNPDLNLDLRVDRNRDVDDAVGTDDTMIPCDGCDTMVRFCDYVAHSRECSSRSMHPPTTFSGVMPFLGLPPLASLSRLHDRDFHYIGSDDMDIVPDSTTMQVQGHHESRRRRRLHPRIFTNNDESNDSANVSNNQIPDAASSSNRRSNINSVDNVNNNIDIDNGHQPMGALLHFLLSGDSGILGLGRQSSNVSGGSSTDDDGDDDNDDDGDGDAATATSSNTNNMNGTNDNGTNDNGTVARRIFDLLMMHGPRSSLIPNMATGSGTMSFAFPSTATMTSSSRIMPIMAMGEYEMNMLLGELLGNVQVGVADVDAVSQICEPHTLPNESICPICQESVQGVMACRRTICNHAFCAPCLEKWFETSKKCPVCMCDLEDRSASPT
jgi:Ring finger domain